MWRVASARRGHLSSHYNGVYGSRRSPGRRGESVLHRSHHLMHVELDAVGMPRACADEQVLHQPAVFFAAGLKFRHRAEIDQPRIDGLAAREAVEGLLRPEADADVLDIDDSAVIHLE